MSTLDPEDSPDCAKERPVLVCVDADAETVDPLEELALRNPGAEAVLVSGRPPDWSFDVYERWRIRRCVRRPYGIQEVRVNEPGPAHFSS